MRFLSRLRMTCVIVALTFAVVSTASAEPDWGSLLYIPFSTMQAVDGTGDGAWSIPSPPPTYEPAYKVRGVVLNNPGDMLDSTSNYIPSDVGTLWQLGAQWQVYIEAVSLPDDPTNHPELVGDFGGAALWMGQNYGNHIWHWNPADFPGSTAWSYTNSEWEAELERLDYADNTITEPLRAGDVIEVHARGGLFYNGKQNVNEEHNNDPALNFDIVVLQRDFILNPTTITLDQVKDASDNFIFDSSRATGAERYQATLVRLENVTVQDPQNWAPEGTVTIASGTRTMPMRLGRDPAFGTSAPAVPFDVVAIFDQEAQGYPPDNTSGYRLWVMDASQFDGLRRVPEPSSVALALAGAVAVLLGLRKRRC